MAKTTGLVSHTEKRLEDFKKRVEILQTKLDPNKKAKVLKSGVVGKVFMSGKTIEVQPMFGLPGNQLAIYPGTKETKDGLTGPATKLAKFLKENLQ